MRVFRFLLILVLLFWYFLSTYWYVCEVKDGNCGYLTDQAKSYYAQLTGGKKSTNTTTATNPKKEKVTPTPKKVAVNIPPLVVRDGAKTLINIKNNFKFTKSSPIPTIDADVSSSLNSLATYLKQNPKRAMQIMGTYTANETKPSNFDNIGLARASKIRQKLVQMGVDTKQLSLEGKLDNTIPNDGEQLLGGITFIFEDKKVVAKTPEPAKEVAVADKKTPAALNLPYFIVKDGKKTVVNVQDKIKFPKSSAKAIINKPIEDGLNNLALYLKNNPNKQMAINGYFSPEEKNSTLFDNLGLARADHLKEKFKTAGIAADRITTNAQSGIIKFDKNTVLGGAGFFISNKSGENAANANANKDKGIVLKDGSKIVTQSQDVFKITQSSATPTYSGYLTKSMVDIGNYLKQNKDRELKVVGSYKADEKNDTKFDNLGLARANDIKKKLMAQGVADKQIVTEAKLDKQLKFNNKTYNGGIDLSMQINKTLAKDLTVKARKLYFASGNASLNVTPELQKYFGDVKTFLKQDVKKKVLLTGHTDNDGEAAANKKLGLSRANTVKDLLVKVGIDKKRIQTSSEGEAKPLKDNKTDKGKQANRRVEVIIK